MAQNERTIYVYENWSGTTPALFGWLRCSQIRGQETFSFEYNPAWLKNANISFSIDPDLSFFHGRQYVPGNKPLFGLFMDSCPDRWGRLLMERKEAIEARKEERKPRKLMESDFLLGIHDASRMGALRFCLEEGGEFLSNDPSFAIPPWVRLRTLQNASLAFEKDESGMEEKWLDTLLAPGSSLGGARPKATVQATDGTLWIAKFPSKNDIYNIGAWEKVVHDLARLCGLNVPDSSIETFSKTGSTFLVKRFDRDKGKRIHYASAMTLLGKTDGASGADGSSYLDLASFIRSNGAAPAQDLHELWKRIVFSMAVSNTDDHLRNHGFLLTNTGWRLAPLFDVNPVPYGHQLSLNVTSYDNTIDFELALEVAEYFAITQDEAHRLVADICKKVSSNWESISDNYGLSRSAREYMRPAFSLCET